MLEEEAWVLLSCVRLVGAWTCLLGVLSLGMRITYHVVFLGRGCSGDCPCPRLPWVFQTLEPEEPLATSDLGMIFPAWRLQPLGDLPPRKGPQEREFDFSPPLGSGTEHWWEMWAQVPPRVKCTHLGLSPCPREGDLKLQIKRLRKKGKHFIFLYP